MSNQNNYYQPPSGPPPGQQQLPQQNNPWAQEQSAGAPGYPPQSNVGWGQYQQQGPPQTSSQGFAPPPRSDTFKESDFVPENERGEQREMMEHFEMSKSGGESREDRDLEQLQREFPGLDGSLVAAIYGDTKDTGASREMLTELARSQQQ